MEDRVRKFKETEMSTEPAENYLLYIPVGVLDARINAVTQRIRDKVSLNPLPQLGPVLRQTTELRSRSQWQVQPE